MSFASLLDTTCTIQANIETSDGQGGYTITWADQFINVPCRFESLDKKLEIIAYDNSAVFPDYWVYMEYLNITESMRITWEGRTFTINHVRDWSHQKKMLKIAVTELGRNE